jgi:hypothetical protein
MLSNIIKSVIFRQRPTSANFLSFNKYAAHLDDVQPLEESLLLFFVGVGKALELLFKEETLLVRAQFLEFCLRVPQGGLILTRFEVDLNLPVLRLLKALRPVRVVARLRPRAYL